MERVNEEIKRRTDAVGVFPNAAALLRLAGSVLVEHSPSADADGAPSEWETGERRYVSEAWMLEHATLNTPVEVIDEAVILEPGGTCLGRERDLWPEPRFRPPIP